MAWMAYTPLTTISGKQHVRPCFASVLIKAAGDTKPMLTLILIKGVNYKLHITNIIVQPEEYFEDVDKLLPKLLRFDFSVILTAAYDCVVPK
jgi:hypothetical protein